jgi:site-specific DNA recombinase
MELATYARRSRAEELAPGEVETSTERQVRDCLAFAALRGWTIPAQHVYAEAGVSGYTGKEREQFERLLAALEAGDVKGVICWKLDRLSRNRHDLHRLLSLAEDQGVVIASVTEGLDTTSQMGGLILELLGGIARMESKGISARTRRAKEELARVGKPAGGGRRRFGFKSDGITHEPAEAELLRQAARDLLAGAGTSAVVKAWNRRGVRMPGGSYWQVTPLRRVLLNPRVAGLRQHRGEVVGEAVWEPILDRAVWDQLRVVLVDRTRQQGGRPTIYLLTGLLRCGACEHAPRLFGRLKGGRRYYTCRQSGLGGCNLKVTADALEQEVEGRVLHALGGAKLAEAQRRAIEGDPEAERLGAAKRQAEAELVELARLKGAGRFTIQEWLELRDPIEVRIRAAESALMRRPKLAALTDVPSTRSGLERAWKRWGLDKRRAVLKAVLESVTVLPVGRGSAGRFDPDRVRCRWLV